MIEENDFIASLKKIELLLRPSKHSRRIGIHHLAHHGRSLEFAGYQEYRPGDDLKDLDWRLFARSDRYYIKQRDTHTLATTLILLDDSPSMGFYSKSAKASKFRGGLLLAFGLGYVLYKQGDAFGFQTLFNEEKILKPRSSKKAFRNFTQKLQKLNDRGPIGRSEFSSQDFQPMSIDHLFIISDFLVPDNQWRDWFKIVKLIARESSCFHMIDPGEEHPDSRGEVRNIENTNEYRFLTSSDWQAYRSEFQKHKQKIRHGCLQQNIAYQVMQTEQPIEKSIQTVLSTQKMRNVTS